jgi:hypothetical protein
MAPPTGVVERQVSLPGDIEPERHEWFLQGTEALRPRTHLTGSFQQVRTPVAGEVIALDPDIPAAYQRVVFVGNDASAAQRWVLNGQELGAVTGRCCGSLYPESTPCRLSMTNDESSIPYASRSVLLSWQATCHRLRRGNGWQFSWVQVWDPFELFEPDRGLAIAGRPIIASR